MDNNNSDMNSHSPITDDDVSKDVYEALLGLVDAECHINGALLDDSERSPQYINRGLDITSPHPLANVYTYPDPPPFVEEALPDEDGSQYFPPTTGHVQDLQDEGVMQSLEGVDGNITSVLNTVHHDGPPPPSSPVPLHTLNTPETKASQTPEPTPNDHNDMPSSASASRTPSPPNNKGRSHTVRQGRYNCTDCGTFSKTKRDHERHLTTKKHQKKTSDGSGSGSGSGSASPAVPGFHCLAQGCEYSHEGGKTFSREDNLWRHMKTVHDIKARA